MLLGHPFFAAPFDFLRDPVCAVTIENAGFFRSWMAELLAQCDGMRGNFILMDGEHELDISKTVECITDLLHIEPAEQKRLCTAVQKDVAEMAMHEMPSELMTLYAAMQELMTALVFRSGMDLEFTEINDIGAFLKLYDLRPSLPEASFAEKMLLYMELCTRYLKRRLFVLVHLQSLLSREEMVSFCKQVAYHHWAVLLIDGVDHGPVEGMRRIIVDKDMCEI